MKFYDCVECFTNGVLHLCYPTLHAVFIFISDVAVQLPDKKSILMYVTSLFAVLPKDVSMEAIREVETLPRKYKTASEDAAAGLPAQVICSVIFGAGNMGFGGCGAGSSGLFVCKIHNCKSARATEGV